MSVKTKRHCDNAGFTLIEVLVALAITGVIAVIAQQAFVSSADSNKQAGEILTELDELGRTWQRLALDFRNLVLIKDRVDEDGNAIKALATETSDGYAVVLYRGGRANLQYTPRSNLERIGYRLVDGVLWRDAWEQGLSTRETAPVAVDLLHGIERLQWRFLPAGAANVEDSTWVDQWPLNNSDSNTLPLGVEITLEGSSFGEIQRIFSILPGVNGK